MIAERFAKLGAREKAGLGLGLLFVLMLILDRLLVHPIVVRYGELNQQIRLKKDALAYNLRVVAMEEPVHREYAALSSLLQKADTEAKAIDAMKGQIDELAVRSGVVLLSREHRKPEQQEYCWQYTVEIREFEAAETNLISFLHQLSSLPGLLRVDRISLTPDRNRNLVKGSMLISKVILSP